MRNEKNCDSQERKDHADDVEEDGSVADLLQSDLFEEQQAEDLRTVYCSLILLSSPFSSMQIYLTDIGANEFHRSFKCIRKVSCQLRYHEC